MSRPASADGGEVCVEGVWFSGAPELELVSSIVRQAVNGSGGVLVTPNLSILRLAQSREMGKLVGRANVRTCDGAPVQWLAALGGSDIPPRVTGSSLIWTLSVALGETAVPSTVLIIGGPPGSAQRAAAKLMPAAGASVTFRAVCPPLGFASDPRYMEDLKEAVRDMAPVIVFVGLGFPRQEQLAEELRKVHPSAWYICCGAAIEFAAGDKQRAPAMMQRFGLEWLHRFVTEPRRLGGRYARDAAFLAISAVSVVRAGVSRSGDET